MFKNFSLVILLLWVFAISGCGFGNDVSVEPYETQYPTPETAVKAMALITSNDSIEQITGMWTMLNFPESQGEAVPLIADNLSDSDVEVRINAAKVLGEIGLPARISVPNLLASLESEKSIKMQIEVTIALGSIGDKTLIPQLAENLYATNEDLAVYSAKSISKLTGISFPDANSSGYHKDKNGDPYILLAAKDWWENEGKYQDWSNP